MKKTLIIGILILTLPTTGQTSHLPKNFFQRWELDYGKDYNGNLIINLPEAPENDYLFKKDKTYILFSSSDQKTTGTWLYDLDEKVIYLYRKDGEINAKIIEITAKHFVLKTAGDHAKSSPVANFQFYYKPAIGSN